MQTRSSSPGLHGASVLIFAALCATITGCGGTSSTVQAAEPDPQAVIQTMLEAQQDAWNKNDNVAYASFFSDDVDFINIRGQIFSGKTAVTQVHAQIFAGPFKGSNISVVIRDFKLLAPRVALVDTDQTVTNYAGLPPGIVPTTTGTLFTHFKYMAVKQDDGSWKFTSGQNTSVLPK